MLQQCSTHVCGTGAPFAITKGKQKAYGRGSFHVKIVNTLKIRPWDEASFQYKILFRTPWG